MALPADEIKGFASVKYSRMPVKLKKEFKQVLDSARTEKPLQKFFEENPAALLTGILAPHRAFVISTASTPET
jgi:hypothetical protein